MNNDLNFVILLNKGDLWFARICVASIRFFYPNNDIFLLPDFANGFFSTKEIELNFNVKVLDYGIYKFGWGIGKLFPIIDEKFKDIRVLMLDADIALLGSLDRDLTGNGIDKNSRDFIVSGEQCDNPYERWAKDIYFDVNAVKQIDVNYDFPGYFFNSGCFIFTGGMLSEMDFELVFNKKKYPFVLREDLLPFPDQSILNFILPIMEKKGKFRIKYDFPFMIWSKDYSRMQSIQLNDVINNKIENLIHWAGDLRSPFLSRMNGSEILIFFENYYYSKIKFGSLVRFFRRYEFVIYTLKKRIASKLKSYLR
jgi:lipopolysaccharide biosynthesis glycosyltransferase